MTLDPETQRLVEERMKRGGYASAAEAVRAGMASLEQQELFGDFAEGELDALLAEGEASGPPLDGDAVLAELRQLRASARSNKAG
jgi:Arc/MetJ-type ribon-helix-helix transcriptional regulator